jgi:hypothetical protein
MEALMRKGLVRRYAVTALYTLLVNARRIDDMQGTSLSTFPFESLGAGDGLYVERLR